MYSDEALKLESLKNLTQHADNMGGFGRIRVKGQNFLPLPPNSSSPKKTRENDTVYMLIDGTCVGGCKFKMGSEFLVLPTVYLNSTVYLVHNYLFLILPTLLLSDSFIYDLLYTYVHFVCFLFPLGKLSVF